MDDSFDLFGGLPTVGGGGDGAADNSVPTKTTEASQDTTATINTSTKNTGDQPSNTKPSAASSIADADKSEALSDKPKESTSSLVSSIGTSGTKLVSYAHILLFESMYMIRELYI